MTGVAPDLTFSTRVAAIAPLALVEMQDRIRAAGAAGRAVAALSGDDPQIVAAPSVMEAMTKALQDGRERYGSAEGDPALRAALAARLNRDGVGAPYDVDDLLITAGRAFSLFACLMTVVEPGAEVILLDPACPFYAEQVRLCGAVPVPTPALTGVDIDRVAAAVTERTRMIVINSPVNPTGRVLTAQELRGLVSLAERRGLWLLFDQTQAELTYADAAEPFAWLHAREGARDRSFLIGSFTKTFGLGGWRMGWLAAPRLAAASARKVLQHIQICPAGFVQAAVLEALALPQDWLNGWIARFQARRDLALARLNALTGVRCSTPAAAGFLFPRVGEDDWDVAGRWLDHCDVATIPGRLFGAAGQGHVRISLGVEDATLVAALDRLQRWNALAALTPVGRVH